MTDTIIGAPEVDGEGGADTDAYLYEQVSEVITDQATDPESPLSTAIAPQTTGWRGFDGSGGASGVVNPDWEPGYEMLAGMILIAKRSGDDVEGYIEVGNVDAGTDVFTLAVASGLAPIVGGAGIEVPISTTGASDVRAILFTDDLVNVKVQLLGGSPVAGFKGQFRYTTEAAFVATPGVAYPPA